MKKFINYAKEQLNNCELVQKEFIGNGMNSFDFKTSLIEKFADLIIETLNSENYINNGKIKIDPLFEPGSYNYSLINIKIELDDYNWPRDLIRKLKCLLNKHGKYGRIVRIYLAKLLKEKGLYPAHEDFIYLYSSGYYNNLKQKLILEVKKFD